MENPPVGLRFRPTDEEIIDVYLRPKNLDEDTSHVDRVISTVTICSFDPWELPSESRMKLKDEAWCFFSRKENKYGRGERQIRKTKSGYWKITVKPKAIMRNRVKIGEKKVLMFYYSKQLGGSKSDWVIHEYHLLSPNQMMMTYTICKVMSKGEEREISSSSTASEVENNHALIPHMNNSGGFSPISEGSSYCQELQNPSQFDGFLDVQQETQLQDAVRRAINNISSDDWNYLLNDDEQGKIVSMQEDCSDYRPQKPLTGVFDDLSSDDNDSDLISATTSSIETSSTCVSIGSSNHRTDQIKTQLSLDSTIKLVASTQEVSQNLGQGTEIREHKLGQETIKKKSACFCNRMIQRFVKKIQLCSPISRT